MVHWDRICGMTDKFAEKGTKVIMYINKVLQNQFGSHFNITLNKILGSWYSILSEIQTPGWVSVT